MIDVFYDTKDNTSNMLKVTRIPYAENETAEQTLERAKKAVRRRAGKAGMFAYMGQ